VRGGIVTTMRPVDVVFPEPIRGRAAVGLLLLRLYAGLALMQHGKGKIADPFHWMDRAPSPPPGFLQALAALSEFGGGLALVLGLLTPVACFGIACTMAFATYTHVAKGDPFVGRSGSFEPALGYLVTAVLLALAGPGAYSLDAQLGAKLRARSAAP